MDMRIQDIDSNSEVTQAILLPANVTAACSDSQFPKQTGCRMRIKQGGMLSREH